MWTSVINLGGFFCCALQNNNVRETIKFCVVQKTQTTTTFLNFVSYLSPCPRLSFVIDLTLRNKGRRLQSIKRFVDKNIIFNQGYP